MPIDLEAYESSILQQLLDKTVQDIQEAEDRRFLELIQEGWGNVCAHCKQPREDHLPDGKCLFGPGQLTD